MSVFYEITVSTTRDMSELVADILMGAGSGGASIRDKSDLSELLETPGKWDYVSRELYDGFPDGALVSGCYKSRSAKTRIIKKLDALKDFFSGFEYTLSVCRRFRLLRISVSLPPGRSVRP